MTAAPTRALYNLEILDLATRLADFAFDEGLSHRAEGRSRTCGSTVSLGVDLAPDGRIERVGMRLSACAIGQASAAILALSARGREAAEIARTAERLEQFLRGEGELPDWPKIAAIAPARDFPARHEAALLAWKTAAKALCTARASG